MSSELEAIRKRLERAKQYYEDAAWPLPQTEQDIVHLLSIVDKLPKTADGVTITEFGGKVILWAPGGMPGVLHFDPTVGWIVWPDDEPNGEVWPRAPFDCYSTQDAAEAAKGGVMATDPMVHALTMKHDAFTLAEEVARLRTELTEAHERERELAEAHAQWVEPTLAPDAILALERFNAACTAIIAAHKARQS